MQNFKAHKKTAERRIRFLENRVSGQGKKANSWDKAELGALTALMRVARVYDDARDDGGSHLENILFMTRDVLTEILEENEDVLDPDALGRLNYAKNKCTEGIDFIHRLGDDS